MSRLYYDVDIHSLLDELKVDYKESGKNVSRGWLGISCPFCEDHSYHCGVHLESKNFTCWICGKKGSLPKLVKQITNLEWRAVFSLINASVSSINILGRSDYTNRSSHSLVMPLGVKNGISRKIKSYLFERGLEPDYLESKYKLMHGLQFGDFKFRLVIPIFRNFELVSFTSRDVTNKSELRYKNLPVSKSIIPVRDCVYNIDNVSDICVITEGVFDAWTADPYGVALFGVNYTANQLYQIYLKKFNKVIVCLDPKEKTKAKKLAMDLASFVPDVKLVQIQSGKDPNDAAPSEIIDIKKECI